MSLVGRLALFLGSSAFELVLIFQEISSQVLDWVRWSANKKFCDRADNLVSPSPGLKPVDILGGVIVTFCCTLQPNMLLKISG